jgi:5-methylcytosine-specific restriction endonuclease McrA
MQNVLLMNADYTPLGLITWHKAIKLMCKKKVEVVKYSETEIYNFEKTVKMLIPAVIRLIKYVRFLYGKRVPFNKHNLLIRDNYTCAYCGIKLGKHNASIDHITPRSMGGLSTFDNTVSACIPCNNKKDMKTCKQANMYPKFKPHTPTITEFVLLHIKNSGMYKMLVDLGIM